MTRALQRLLIAIVALALLAAPCLSVLTPFGGSAYADHLAIGVAAHDVAGDAHRHGGAHDHARTHQYTSAPSAPSHDHADCCCECYGWIMAKAAANAPPSAVSAVRPQFDPAILPAGPRPRDLAGYISERSSPAHLGSQFTPVSDGPVYAVTGRFRI